MNQFQRGREAVDQARQRRELRVKEAATQPRTGVAIYAVNQTTQEKKLVGVAMSDSGAEQLVSTEHSNYPGCKFFVVPTVILLV